MSVSKDAGGHRLDRRSWAYAFALGNLASQFLLNIISQSLTRAVVLQASGVPMSATVAATYLDRLIALATIGIGAAISALTLFGAFSFKPQEGGAYLLSIAVGIPAVLGVVGFPSFVAAVGCGGLAYGAVKRSCSRPRPRSRAWRAVAPSDPILSLAIGILAASLIYFQLRVPTGSGEFTVNTADPLAITARFFAAVLATTDRFVELFLQPLPIQQNQPSPIFSTRISKCRSKWSVNSPCNAATRAPRRVDRCPRSPYPAAACHCDRSSREGPSAQAEFAGAYAGRYPIAQWGRLLFALADEAAILDNRTIAVRTKTAGHITSIWAAAKDNSMLSAWPCRRGRAER